MDNGHASGSFTIASFFDTASWDYVDSEVCPGAPQNVLMNKNDKICRFPETVTAQNDCSLRPDVIETKVLLQGYEIKKNTRSIHLEQIPSSMDAKNDEENSTAETAYLVNTIVTNVLVDEKSDVQGTLLGTKQVVQQQSSKNMEERGYSKADWDDSFTPLKTKNDSIRVNDSKNGCRKEQVKRGDGPWIKQERTHSSRNEENRRAVDVNNGDMKYSDKFGILTIKQAVECLENPDDLDFDVCLKCCEDGMILRRVKKGKISEPLKIYIKSSKYFIYPTLTRCSLFPPCKLGEINEHSQIRCGFSTDSFYALQKKESFQEKVKENQCCSVLFDRPGRKLKCLDLIASSEDDRNILTCAVQGLIDQKVVASRIFNEEAWLAEAFKDADTNCNGAISFEELMDLLGKLNMETTHEFVKRMLNESFASQHDSKASKMITKISRKRELSLEEFLDFFEKITKRPEISRIIKQHSSDHSELMTKDDLKRFMEVEQEAKNIDDRYVNEVLMVDEKNKPIDVIGPIGFRRLLSNRHFKIQKEEWQDMNQPLPHYFINSSHNTYLTGSQLLGSATIEGYLNAMRNGSRLLELDVFDGENGQPVITHKHSFISPITLLDALKAIEKKAFSKSDYPLILTIENHVSVEQQRIMAALFKTTFGDQLYLPPSNSASLQFPSPEALRRKVLLRGKKIMKPDDREEFDEDFSKLIALPSVKISDDVEKDICEHPLDGSPSISESVVEEYIELQKDNPLPAYTAKRLVKSYPRRMRQDSSNMHPVNSWLCGIQSVAMNMQTPGLELDLNAGLFSMNGGCGYVLKPDILLNGIDPFGAEVASQIRCTLIVSMISAQYLPKPYGSNDIIDPYVVVEIHGIPDDNAQFETEYIHNNGFNPLWDQKFLIHLRCPELAFLRIRVMDHSETSSDQFIGENTFPVRSIKQGYCQVPLNTGEDHKKDPSANIFMQIKFA